MLRWKHVSRTLSYNCVVITVYETLFYTLMPFNGQMVWSPRTLDSFTCNRRVQAWNVMFWWGYNADDPHPLVAVSSSRRESRICTSMYSVDFADLILHNNVKYARWGTNYLYKKSRQNLRQQIYRKALFASILSDPDQNQEWLGCVGTKWR